MKNKIALLGALASMVMMGGGSPYAYTERTSRKDDDDDYIDCKEVKPQPQERIPREPIKHIVRGSVRNAPCKCGSGLKTKNCCKYKD